MKRNRTSTPSRSTRSFESSRRSMLARAATLAVGGTIVRGAAARQAGAEPAALRVLDPGRAGEFVTTDAAPRIVHLWGLSCSPCLVELPRWGDFARRHPDWKLVFLQVDPAPAERVSAALRRAGLEQAENWTVAAPLDERARYRLDADWAGELPRTLMIAADAPPFAVSGHADFDAIRDWCARRCAATASAK